MQSKSKTNLAYETFPRAMSFDMLNKRAKGSEGERPEKAQGPPGTQEDLIKRKGFKRAIGWYTCKGKAFTFTPPAWATAGKPLGLTHE